MTGWMNGSEYDVEALREEMAELFRKGVKAKLAFEEENQNGGRMSKLPENIQSLLMYVGSYIPSGITKDVLLECGISAEKIPEYISIMGETVNGSIVVRPGTYIVLLGNPNSHDYSVGEPILAVDNGGPSTDRAMTMELYHGNHFPLVKNMVRTATEDEIVKFLVAYETKRYKIKRARHPNDMAAFMAVIGSLALTIRS